MRAARDDICDQLEIDLCFARLAHVAARRRSRLEATAESRAAEAECLARVDVILDLLIELRRPAGGVDRRADVPRGSRNPRR